MEEAISYAYLLKSMNGSTQPARTTISSKSSVSPQTGFSELPVRKFSYAELMERREKGLCYHCDEKFLPGHACKQLFVPQGDWLGEVNDEEGIREVQKSSLVEYKVIPKISFDAFAGEPNPQTMKLHGSIQKFKDYILIDSGSTHNFLSGELASRLHLPISTSKKLTVVVGNGVRFLVKDIIQN